MKDRWYLPTEPYFIGKYKAVQHKTTKEYALIGKIGHIWEDGTNFKAWITSNEVASRITGDHYKRGEEAVVSFSPDKLEFFVKLLKVYTKQPVRQIKQANKYGE